MKEMKSFQNINILSYTDNIITVLKKINLQIQHNPNKNPS